MPNQKTVAVTVQAQMYITCLTSDYWSGWPWSLLISVLMRQTSRTNSTNPWRANNWNVKANTLQSWFQICIGSSPPKRDVVLGDIPGHQVCCQCHSKFLGCEPLINLCGLVDEKCIVYRSFQLVKHHSGWPTLAVPSNTLVAVILVRAVNPTHVLAIIMQ